MLTAERLRELFNYDPLTGAFTRKVKTAPNATMDRPAGTIRKDGYYVLRVDNKLYLLHRCAWLYMTGEWPTHEIDHTNLKGSDNRWCNLREATSAQNGANSHVRSHNKLGVKGVYKARGKRHGYIARISVDGATKHLGYFKTIDDAAAAYAAAASELHGNFARTTRKEK